MSKRWIYMSKGKEGSSLKKLAAGSLTFVKAYSNGQANSAIDELEHELETEIERDRQKVPDTAIARLRHRGGKILHGKQMLLLVVVLNILDCALVLGELVLDLNHVKDILSHSQKTSSIFLHGLQNNYPNDVVFTDIDDLQKIYQQILTADISWNNHVVKGSPYSVANSTRPENRTNNITTQDEPFKNTTQFNQPPSRVKRDTGGGKSVSCDLSVSVSGSGQLHSNSIEERVANGLHKTSLTIVCVLLMETILKIFCFGKAFFDQKLEVFDAFVVLVSFIVDLMFLEGLSAYSLQEFVYILAFILPWGVIRVVNSLVVAVRDHEHFRLKLLYTQKKKVDSDNKHIRQEKDKLIEQVDSLRRLCLGQGLDDFRIQESMSRSSSRPGKGIMGSFASLAMGAIGGGKSNGTSFWNLLNTPRMKRGKSEEWEGKLGLSKDDRSRLWTVSGSTDIKKPKKSHSLSQQVTSESDPGTPPSTIRGRLRALKKFLKRQETVDSYSSTETIDKHSRCSLDRLSSSDNFTPVHSIDIESVHEVYIGEDNSGRMSKQPCDVINECVEDKLEWSSSLGNASKSDDDNVNTSPSTAINVTTCDNAEDCDSLTISVGGRNDSVKNRMFNKRTMEIAVDIEHNASEVVPMLPAHEESDDSPQIPLSSPPSLPLDLTETEPHKLVAEIDSETTTAHVGLLQGLDCGNHSHSSNCIPTRTQQEQNNCEVQYMIHSDDIAMQHESSDISMMGKMQGSSDVMQHKFISNSNYATDDFLDTSPLPNIVQSKVNSLKPPRRVKRAHSNYLRKAYKKTHSAPINPLLLANILHPKHRTHPISSSPPHNITYIPNGTPKQNTAQTTTLNTTHTANSEHSPKRTKFSNGMQSPNATTRTDRTLSPVLAHYQNRPYSPTTPPQGSPSPQPRHISSFRLRRNPSPPPQRNPSPLPQRSPNPLPQRSPSPLPQRSPSPQPRLTLSQQRAPSPTNFIHVHTSNSDLTGLSPLGLYIPETHLYSPQLPSDNFPLVTSTDMDLFTVCASSPNDRYGSSPQLSPSSCPVEEPKARTNSYHHPSSKACNSHHEFNAPKELDLSDTTSRKITDPSRNSPARSDPVLYRRSSTH